MNVLDPLKIMSAVNLKKYHDHIMLLECFTKPLSSWKFQPYKIFLMRGKKIYYPTYIFETKIVFKKMTIIDQFHWKLRFKNSISRLNQTTYKHHMITKLFNRMARLVQPQKTTGSLYGSQNWVMDLIDFSTKSW